MPGSIENHIMVDSQFFLTISPPHWMKYESDAFCGQLFSPHSLWLRKSQSTKAGFHFISAALCENPECFKLMDGVSPPLPYKNQSNAWFNWKSHHGGFSIFSDHITSALNEIWIRCFLWTTVQPTLFMTKKKPIYQSGFSFYFCRLMWLIYINHIIWV